MGEINYRTHILIGSTNGVMTVITMVARPAAG
jgi:hypothetical protein